MNYRLLKIGSVTSPVKRALVEMLQYGSLARNGGGWFSCNGAKFYDCTVITMVETGLAIYSINAKLPGQKFVRLNATAENLARAILAEKYARKVAQAAAEKVVAEIMQACRQDANKSGVVRSPVVTQPKSKAVVVP